MYKKFISLASIPLSLLLSFSLSSAKADEFPNAGRHVLFFDGTTPIFSSKAEGEVSYILDGDWKNEEYTFPSSDTYWSVYIPEGASSIELSLNGCSIKVGNEFSVTSAEAGQSIVTDTIKNPGFNPPEAYWGQELGSSTDVDFPLIVRHGSFADYWTTFGWGRDAEERLKICD